ncbi:MAG: glycosyltransferase family 39 protein [Candidatus Eisenbacteria bacterium]
MVADRFRTRLVWLVGLALGLRLLVLVPVLLDPTLSQFPDSTSYLAPAQNLLADHGFSQDLAPPFEPDLFRTPVYPFFLATIWKVTGESLRAIAVVQVMLDVLTCALLGLLTRRLFGSSAGLVSAFFYAASLVSIAHVGLIASETLFVALLVGLAWLVLGGKSIGLPKALAVGAVWGLLTLCRPIGLVLLPLLVLGVAIRSRRRLLAPALMTLVGVLSITPWLLRNHEIAGVWTLASVGEYNLLAYNAASVEAARRGVSHAEARETLLRDVNAQLVTQGRDGIGDRIRAYRETGRAILLRDPVESAIVHLRCDLNSLLPAVTDVLQVTGVTEGGKGTLSVLNQHGVSRAIDHYFGDRRELLLPLAPGIVVWFGMLFLSVVGMALAWRDRAWTVLLVVGGSALLLLLAPGAPSNPRFAAPIVPGVACFAGLGTVRTWRYLQERRRAGRAGRLGPEMESTPHA